MAETSLTRTGDFYSTTTSGVGRLFRATRYLRPALAGVVAASVLSGCAGYTFRVWDGGSPATFPVDRLIIRPGDFE